MFNKEKTKKVIIAVLFIVAVIGLVGYGVYSVEYENGTFVSEASISIGTFDPQTIISDTASFLGDGGNVNISCPSISGNISSACTGSITIKNNGDGPIVVEVLDAEEDEDEYAGTRTSDFAQFMHVEASNPIYNWKTKVLAPKETVVLNISVPIEVTSDYYSQEEVEFSNSGEPLDGDTEEIQVRFSIRASQYLGE